MWVGGRRWNIQLDHTIEVKLPEENLAESIQRLGKVLQQSSLDFTRVKTIDLRQPQQIAIRLSNDSAI
jgi:cell division protein FtsQ